MKNNNALIIEGLVGKCGHFDVFLGVASAEDLHACSMADVLDEETGVGYQRPYNKSHSLDFRRYINLEKSSTIPLVFNLRKEVNHFWKLELKKGCLAHLSLMRGVKSLIIVDGQHRIGEMVDVSLPLAFMAFIGLDIQTEMALFTIINSKAKGLTNSLTDYLQSKLMNDITHDAPHLCIARRLNEDPNSPWYRLIRYGGETTSGLKRRTSLRMMQKSIEKFLKHFKNRGDYSVEQLYDVVLSFWRAVSIVFSEDWQNHRHSLLTKGLGLYSLMLLMGHLSNMENMTTLNEQYFIKQLQRLTETIEWSSKGMFSETGGQKGAVKVFEKLRRVLEA